MRWEDVVKNYVEELEETDWKARETTRNGCKAGLLYDRMVLETV